jgi:hypothetical protein
MSALRTPARDVLVARLALAALRGLGVVLRALGRGILAAARWSVPSLAAPRRTTASGLTIAAVLAVITGDLAVPLIVAAVWLTVAWAGRRMTARAISAGRIPVAALRMTTRTATRAARREIERGIR